MAPKKSPKTPATKSPKKQAGATYSQYASTTQSATRRWLFTGPAMDARKDLTSVNRLQMIAKSRWALRNSPTYKQVIDEVVLVTIGDELMAQSHAQDPKKALLYQEYFRNWSKKCDITGRFTFGQVQKLSLSGSLSDGDSFIVETFDAAGRPRVQLLEAHRVGSPQDKVDPTCVDGVYLGQYGEVRGYNVYVDGDVKNRFIPAESMSHVVEFDRSSAVRGAPVLQSSFNSVQDQLEVFELEKTAVRTASDHVMLLKKSGGVLQDDAAAQFAGGSVGNSCERLVSQMGGKIAVVDTNEDLTQIQNTRPSPAWIGMMKAIERDIVKLLPVEYVSDPSGITGPAIRLVAAKVSRVAGKWQNLIIDTVCDPTWDYVIGWGIENGELPEDPWFNKKSWITPRDVTVDAGREAAQDRADLQMGLTTSQAILGKKGMTFDEVLETLATEAEKRITKAKERNLPLWMLYQSSFNWLQQGQTPAQMSQDVADNLDVPEPTDPSTK